MDSPHWNISGEISTIKVPCSVVVGRWRSMAESQNPTIPAVLRRRYSGLWLKIAVYICHMVPPWRIFDNTGGSMYILFLVIDFNYGLGFLLNENVT